MLAPEQTYTQAIKYTQTVKRLKTTMCMHSWGKLWRRYKKKKKRLISCSGFSPVNAKNQKGPCKKANLKQPQPRAKRRSKAHRPWTAGLLRLRLSCWTDPNGEDGISPWTSRFGVKLVQGRIPGLIRSTLLEPKFSL